MCRTNCCARARAALGLSQIEAAKLSKVSIRTIIRLEKNELVTLDTLRRVQVAFEELGVRFLRSSDGEGPGLRMRGEIIAREELRF
jgi:transcriptional regulator with XRE-family HTH domain